MATIVMVTATPMSYRVVATPGRFLHLVVEMELKLLSIEYVVFDEADRLFEMGFSEQLREILRRLPEMRYIHHLHIVQPMYSRHPVGPNNTVLITKVLSLNRLILLYTYIVSGPKLPVLIKEVFIL